jgi:hypothetical protein
VNRKIEGIVSLSSELDFFGSLSCRWWGRSDAEFPFVPVLQDILHEETPGGIIGFTCELAIFGDDVVPAHVDTLCAGCGDSCGVWRCEVHNECA